jgi:uncharacterized protein (TIGR00299 family) protein
VSLVYFDPFSGASGDMILGALVDAGAPEEAVRGALAGLRVADWKLELHEVVEGGLRATRVEVDTDDDVVGRSYEDVLEVLDGLSLPGPVHMRAATAFDLLARAEARVHGVEPSEVHFHEVGSLDAIVDVVGCCAALEHLRPERVVTSAIATGTGTTESSHGLLPLPAPAVAEILTGRGAPLFGRGRGELITPTGAALLAAFTDSFAELPTMTVESVGYGAGRAHGSPPNVLRVIVGRAVDVNHHEDAVVVETNVDDMSPELIPDLIELLLGAGAHDAWVTPIVMKKGRPAYVVSTLVSPGDRQRIADIVFKETTTFGVRWRAVTKEVLPRRWVETTIGGNLVRVKVAEREGRVVSMSPEHDDALTAARATGLPLRDVYARALRAAEEARE